MSSDTLTLPLPELAEQFMLRRDITFLNHGSYGACPRPVFDVYQSWQREVELDPVDFFSRRIKPALAEARAALGAYLGAPADDVVFVPNATHGMNIIAHSLALQPGDEILTTDHEYGAIERTWRFNCERTGAKYVIQPVTLPLESNEAIVDQIWAGVTERTRVISISHITSPTAIIMPIELLCKRARAAGILVAVDGAHAPGQIPLDMQAIGADFYASNCHKWLSAPKGTGFLYARREQQAVLHPLVVSHGWRPRNPGPSTFLDYYEWTGTDDPAAYLSVPAAIEFQQRNNWPAVRAACHTLVLEAERQILALSGQSPISPEKYWVQMRSIPLPECDTLELGKRLWDEYRIEIPLVFWNERPFVRISIQAYNHPEHVDRLVTAITRCLD